MARLSLSSGPSTAWEYLVTDWQPGQLDALVSGVCGSGPVASWDATWWGVSWATEDGQVLNVGSRGGALAWVMIHPGGSPIYGHVPNSQWADADGKVVQFAGGITGFGLDRLALRIRAGRLEVGDADGRVWVPATWSGSEAYLQGPLPAFTRTALFLAVSSTHGAAVSGVLS